MLNPERWDREIRKLVERGLMDLDVPISEYVPQLRFADGEPPASMTLRRLLSHSAGPRSITG